MSDAKERMCVKVPFIDDWYSAAEHYPQSDEMVLAFAEVNGSRAVCQVVFYGNDFCHEWRLGDTAVFVTHWVYLEVPQ